VLDLRDRRSGRLPPLREFPFSRGIRPISPSSNEMSLLLFFLRWASHVRRVARHSISFLLLIKMSCACGLSSECSPPLSPRASRSLRVSSLTRNLRLFARPRLIIPPRSSFCPFLSSRIPSVLRFALALHPSAVS